MTKGKRASRTCTRTQELERVSELYFTTIQSYLSTHLLTVSSALVRIREGERKWGWLDGVSLANSLIVYELQTGEKREGEIWLTSFALPS